MRTDAFKVTVEYNDGTEPAIRYYSREKVARSIAKGQLKHSVVKSVTVEEN